MDKENKPMTVSEAGKRGGNARAEKYSPEQLQQWAKKGGWPKGRPRKRKTVEEAKSPDSKGGIDNGSI